MSRPSRSADDLARLVLSAGFTPAASEIPTLLDRLSTCDEADAKLIVRALLRAGPLTGPLVLERFQAARAPARARMVALVGRIAAQQPEARLLAFLRERVGDQDPKARRRAVAALGRLGPAALGDAVGLEKVLLQVLASTADRAAAQADGARRGVSALPDQTSTDLAEQKAAAEALGKVGGDAAIALLRSLEPTDPELQRIVREALVRLDRSARRGAPSEIDLDRTPQKATRVLLHVRAGLEPLLVSELDSSLKPRVAGPGRVLLELTKPLRTLFAARTFLHVGFPLPAVETRRSLDDAVAAALTSDMALAVLRTFTLGTIRYRIEWRGQGHRRAATYRLAEAIARTCPDLINDPRGATWEAVVTVRGEAVWVELWPRAFDDPRFSYRACTVPASSHPTIAAALARVGGFRPDDVVWDPFVGAGAELVERSLFGPCRRLYGSDLAQDALDAARTNLERQGVQASLHVGDARDFRPPEAVSLIITNPPMGRRLVGPGAVDALLDRALGNFVRALAPGGRLVWMAPHAERSLTEARRLGFSAQERIRVDMGGFEAELQLLVAPARRRSP